MRSNPLAFVALLSLAVPAWGQAPKAKPALKVPDSVAFESGITYTSPETLPNTIPAIASSQAGL